MTDLPNNSGDELRDELHELTESFPVGPTEGLSPQDRHSQRTRRNRVGAASFAALAIGSIAIVSTRESPDAGTVIAAADNSVNLAVAPDELVSFNQRIVDGVVSYGEATVQGDDGTVYILSTSPDAEWPSEAEMATMDEMSAGFFGSLPQAIYSTTDGENWTITELGDTRIMNLVERDGLLYSLTTSEGEDGVVSASYVSSSDGGATWSGPTLDFGPPDSSGAAQQHVVPYSDYQLVANDSVQLAIRSTYWDLDWEWLQSELGIGPDHYPDFEDDRVVVRDWAACDSIYEAQIAEEERQIQELMASGMTEQEAYEAFYGESYGHAYDEPDSTDLPTVTTLPPSTVLTETQQESDFSTTTGPPEEADATPLDPETTTTVGWEAYDEPPECMDPPIIVEKSLEELGLKDFSPEGNHSQTALRSTDGVNWEPVDVPGDWVMSSGSLFLAQDFSDEYGEPEADDSEVMPTFYTSADGLSWTEQDPDAAPPFYREVKSPLNGQFTSFVVEYPDYHFEDQYDEGDEYSATILFGTSPDGTSWSDVAVTTFTEGPDNSAWPVVQEVGPLGAVLVVQHYEYSKSEESYSDYLESLSYTILYSQDGKAWQEIELEMPLEGDLSYGFVTGDSIALTFQSGNWDGDEKLETKTLLLTPER